MWFPWLDLAAARLLGKTYHQTIEESSEDLAQSDINGLYRVLLKFTSVKPLSRRIGALNEQYFNYARVQTTELGEKCVEVATTGWPRSMTQFWWLGNRPYMSLVFRCAGAKKLDFVGPTVEDAGENSGIPVTRTRIKVTWE